MTTTVYVRGNIAANEIGEIQSLVNQRDSLSQHVIFATMNERFDANYVSLGADIVGVIAGLLYVLLEFKNLFKNRGATGKNENVEQNLRQKLSASAHKDVEVVQISFSSRESITVTLFEQSRNRSITVTYSLKDKKAILDIS